MLFYGYMDGLAVFNFTINEVPKSIKAAMAYAGITEEKTDKLFLHQANKQIVQAVGTESDFPLEKVPYDAFENFGNNTMCSIPTNINYLYKDNMTEDKHIVCSAIGNGLAVKTGAFTLSENIYF